MRMARLSKKTAEEIAIKVCGTKKGLEDTGEGKIVNSYALQLEKIRIEISEDWQNKGFVRVDMTFNDHNAPAWYNIETLENDIDMDESWRRKVKKETCEECNLYLAHKEAEYRRNHTWRYGVLSYDYSQGRYDIRYDDGSFYGGLHCGSCFDIQINGEWKPTRIESNADGYYLIDVPHDALQRGTKVRT